MFFSETLEALRIGTGFLCTTRISLVEGSSLTGPAVRT
jgi:hypothetical protein